MGRYHLSIPAQADFAEIGRYTQARWGTRQRRIYLGQLIDGFDVLVENPSLGRDCDDIVSGLLSYPIQSHLVYFRRAGSVVEIARILHGKQSPEKTLRGVI